MEFSNKFFNAIGISSNDTKKKRVLAKATGISLPELKYYNDKNILPTGKDLEAIIREVGVSETELKLKMGRIDSSTKRLLLNSVDQVLSVLPSEETKGTYVEKSLMKNSALT